MFDQEWVSGLDAADACAAVADAHSALVEVETRQLLLAAHWIDLHSKVDEPDTDGSAGSGAGGRVLPGTGRWIRVGAEGTPDVDEFASAEFAALQDMHPLAGATLLRKVANLRERHPRLWSRVVAKQVRGWKALEAARIVGLDEYKLSREQARWIDEKTFEWIDTLPWGEFLRVLQARIIACDPAAAEQRRQQAEAERFVATGQSNEYGLKTLIAKATAGEVIYLLAVCDRIAQILAARGDTDPVGARRSKALGILANPASALALLTEADAEAAAAEVGDAGDADGEAPDRETAENDEAEDGETGEPDLSHRAEPAELTAGDLDPAYDDSDAGDAAASSGPDPCPTCGGGAPTTGGRSPFVKRSKPDLSKVLPRATLYIHLTQHGFETGEGVARMEGVGPITVGQARDFLRHSRVRVLPVLDLAERRSVDSYEFPASMREAVHLISPREVFPFGTATSRRVDIDHPVPYLSPDDGGPPGQTRVGNSAPLRRFHHRLKTHGRWGLRQLEPGTYLWRSPHGWYWLVDHTGTHALPRHLGRLMWHALRDTSDAA